MVARITAQRDGFFVSSRWRNATHTMIPVSR
jgi:hypothetical protein